MNEQGKPVISYKIILCGNHQSGKTLFIRRLTDTILNFDSEIPETQATIATNLICHKIEMNGTVYKLQLWDTAGQEAYHSITASYFRSCQGVFLVFDITDEKSFKDLDYWINMIKEHSNTTSSNADSTPLIVVIANKIDCPKEKHQVDIETISNSCRERDLDYFITSALTGENVKNAADFMVKKLTERRRVKANEETINLTENTSTNKGCC